MSKKFSKFTKTLVAMLGVATLGVAALGVATISADAEATTYKESNYSYMQLSNGVSAKYYTNKASAINSSWPGLRMEFTVEEGVTDMSVSMKGIVYPTSQNLNMTMDASYDIDGNKIPTADAIVMTYTSPTNPDYEFSLVCFNRYGTDMRSWYTVALTGDLEWRNGFMYIKGTDQSPIGRMDNGTYNAYGYTYWSAGEYNWGALFGANPNFQAIGTGGTTAAIKYNSGTTLCDMLDANFLTKGSENLANSEYKERYTAEWVNAMLTEMNSSGAVLTFSYYGLKTKNVAMNFIMIDDEDIGSGKDFYLKPYMNVPCGTEFVAYADEVETTKINDLFKVEDMIVMYYPFNSNGTTYMSGFLKSKTWNTGTWYNCSETSAKTLSEYGISSVGKYDMITQAQSGMPTNLWLNTGYFTYVINVIEKPTLSFGDTEFTGKIGDTVVVPEGENSATQAFAGWTSSSGEFVLPGASITIKGDETYTATYIDFGVIKGASVRMVAPYGIRFTTQIEKSAVEAFENGGFELVSVITKITSVSSENNVEIALEKQYDSEDGNFIMFNAALVDILPENLTRIYYAQTFMTVKDASGNEWTIESTVASEEGRSYAQVIEAAKNEVDTNENHGYNDYQVSKINEMYAEVVNTDTAATVTFEIVAVVSGVEVDQTANYAELIKGFMADKNYTYGDTVTVDEASLPTVAGYKLDTTASALEAVCGVRGAQIKIVYVPEE